MENRIRIWKQNRHKKPVTEEMREESAKVKALNRQIMALEKINESLFQQIEDLTEHLSSVKTGTMEDKLVDLAINMFAKPNNAKVINHGLTQTTLGSPLNTNENLESGKEYSDDELKQIITQIPEKQKKLLLSLPDDQISKTLNNRGFNISDTSIKRAKELMNNV